MKFPGKRKSKHYFPVSARDPLLRDSMLHAMQPEPEGGASYIVGIDQTIVDIEMRVDESFVAR